MATLDTRFTLVILSQSVQSIGPLTSAPSSRCFLVLHVDPHGNSKSCALVFPILP